MEKLKIELTDDLKTQLQGFLPMREDATITFKSEVYDTMKLPKEIKEQIVPTITIRQWTNKEIINVKEQSQLDAKFTRDMKDKDEVKVQDQRTILYKLIKNAIVSIDNLYDSDLQIIDWKKEHNLIPTAIIIEIFNKLYSISGLEQETIATMLNMVKKKMQSKQLANDISKDEPKEA